MTPVAVPTPTRLRPLAVLAFGVALGFSLSKIGFTSFTELHEMFALTELRMFLVFVGGVALTAVGLFAVGRHRHPTMPLRAIHRGTIPGAVLFGLGWAIAGACPGVAFAQLGEGKLWALATVAGIVVGTLACAPLGRRLGLTQEDRCG
jgi:uncharacterized protein